MRPRGAFDVSSISSIEDMEGIVGCCMTFATEDKGLRKILLVFVQFLRGSIITDVASRAV